MSEISPGGTGCFSDRDVPEGAIGVPLPSVRMRVVDPETMKDVKEGEEGELWVQGPNVMVGYREFCFAGRVGILLKGGRGG